LSHYEDHVRKIIDIQLTGKHSITGKLIDYGLDIIVVYDGEQYLYIPTVHIEHFKNASKTDVDFDKQTGIPITNEDEKISLRKVLTNAKGVFIELFVTGRLSLHGYVTNILNNYFTFYSPIYKTMFISLEHVKWLTPYKHVQTPYSLSSHEFPLHPSNIPLSRTLEEQLKKWEGHLVVFDLGQTPHHIGLLRKVENSLIELITARNETVHLNQKHIKTIHLP